MAMNRICILSFSAGYGGVSSAQYSLLRHWEGRNPVLFIDEAPQFSLQKLKGENLKTLKYAAIPIWTDRMHSNTIIDRINEFKPEVVFVTNIALMVFHGRTLRKYCNKSKCKLRVIVHSGMLGVTIPRIFLEIAESFAFLIADEIIFVSQYTKKRWTRYYWCLQFKKMRVVFNSIHPMPELMHKKTVDKIRVGYVGLVGGVKRPELFCRIARKAKIDCPSMEFVIYGEGEKLELLKKKYIDCVNFEYISAEQDAIYNKIDILVMTSKVENCSMAILEAMVRGIPVVAPLVGGNPEIIENNKTGYLVKIANPECFLRAIINVEKKYEELSRNCIKKRWQYSAKNISDRLLEGL